MMDSLADRFDPEYYLAWMKSNWTLSFYISAIYVILVFYGQVITNSRDLRMGGREGPQGLNHRK